MTYTHAACSSATTFSRRIAYDNRSHPVLQLGLLISSGCNWQPLAGPVQLDPVLWHLVGINKSLEYRFGASLGEVLIKVRRANRIGLANNRGDEGWGALHHTGHVAYMVLVFGR